MENTFSRTELLLGREGMERLSRSRVAVFGIGGVGGYVVEALARSGVGALDLIDSDRVSLSNLNRQILATVKTLGRCKVDAARERVADINPQAQVRTYPIFYGPETADQFDFSQYDYVVDAIDTVTGKIDLAVRALGQGVPIISSMGAGNKLDASALEVADLAETSVCPLARVMRRELKRRGIRHLKVVYSKEPPMKPLDNPSEDLLDDSSGVRPAKSPREGTQRRQTPGSLAFVPAVAGMILAGEVVRDLAGFSRKESP